MGVGDECVSACVWVWVWVCVCVCGLQLGQKIMIMGTRDEDILQDVPEEFDESDVIKTEDWGFEVQAVKDRCVWERVCVCVYVRVGVSVSVCVGFSWGRKS